MKLDYKIGDIIDVPDVKTVIRLEDGVSKPALIAESFVFTDEVEAHFHVLSRSLQNSTGQGYFLQGDFGSGKSHFLASLSTFLCGGPGSDTLSANHSGLTALKESEKKFIPVNISLVNYRAGTHLEEIIIMEIENQFQAAGIPYPLTPLKHFLKHLKAVLESDELCNRFSETAGINRNEILDWIDTNPREAYIKGTVFLKSLGLADPEALVEERYETFRRVFDILNNTPFTGLVLIIDELSEFLHSKPNKQSLNEDARILQFLGELSSQKPLWIIAAVQESIEKTGDIAGATFRKIKDRYPVKLTLSTLHIQSLISRRLVKHKNNYDEVIPDIYKNYSEQFSTFHYSFTDFMSIYPVHPATLSLLNGLGELFSVHRGIVDFIHSQIKGDTGRNIPGIMDRTCTELLAPDSIYNHFEQRIAEYSGFNIYPRHIVPHLDQVSDRLLEEEEDRRLARRLIRMLVLYKIHPTAKTPNVRELTELAACDFSLKDINLNVDFIAQSILDPIVDESRFLVKNPPSDGDKYHTVYTISAEEDPDKILKARFRQAENELPDTDSRLLKLPLSEMAESFSWPGNFIDSPLKKTIVWRLTNRTVLLAFLENGEEGNLKEAFKKAFTEEDIDFALIITIRAAGTTDFIFEHTAVWETGPVNNYKTLTEYLAAKITADKLSPSNPQDALLMERAFENVEKIKPLAHKAALDVFYQGCFTDSSVPFEPALSRVKRFDRILELAAEYLLDKRYPRFSSIAPRKINPSAYNYKRLITEFIVPGNILLQEARTKGLTDLIEGLAVPLGMVELKSGRYLFLPDTTKSSFLSYFFKCLNPSAPKPLSEIIPALKKGPYGVYPELIHFLLASLASAGLIMLLKKGRAVSYDYIDFISSYAIDAVAPGEIINDMDKTVLLEECLFLQPPEGFTTFGLKQQREAWQALVKFKHSSASLAGKIQKHIARVADYKSFANFNLNSIKKKYLGLLDLSNSIKVSYPAKEGLEHFLEAWRKSGLKAGDIDDLKNIEQFFSRYGENYIFIIHYIQHPCLIRAAQEKKEILKLYHELKNKLKNPEEELIRKDFQIFRELFTRLRLDYFKYYKASHEAYYNSFLPPKLTKYTERALKVLSSLAGIEALDRPEGLHSMLRLTEGTKQAVCTRNLQEELERSPLCACGYKPGDRPAEKPYTDLEGKAGYFLDSYAEILKGPDILEALSARIYALKDARPGSVKVLKRLKKYFSNPDFNSTMLLDAVNEMSVPELSNALSAKIVIEHRSLNELLEKLAGRRLDAEQILSIVHQWCGEIKANTLMALDLEPLEDKLTSLPSWWPTYQNQKLKKVFSQETDSRQVQQIQKQLEENYPAHKLYDYFYAMAHEKLCQFILTEKYHLNAIIEALNIFTIKYLKENRTLMIKPGYSEYIMPDISGKIDHLFHTLEKIGKIRKGDYPERLLFRLYLWQLNHHPYVKAEAKTCVKQVMSEEELLASKWLENLKPVSVIPLKINPVVVIIDGVSADVLLYTCLNHSLSLPGLEFRRLESLPNTIDSIAAMFNFKQEPLSAFHALDIPFYQLKGDENASIFELLPPFKADKPAVMRFSLIDSEAHKQDTGFEQMSEALWQIFQTKIEPLITYAQKNKRALFVTTDHGFSFSKEGFSHGSGGLYERIIFVSSR